MNTTNVVEDEDEDEDDDDPYEGMDDGAIVECPVCEGMGEYGHHAWWGECPLCVGEGRVTVEDAREYDLDALWMGIDEEEADRQSAAEGCVTLEDVSRGLQEKAFTTEHVNFGLVSVREEAAPGVNWSGICFPSVNDGADFSDLNLAGSNLAGCTLEDVTFERANLTSVILTDAFLSWARFGDATLDGANFVDADLKEADFSSASVRDAQFTRANMTGCTIERADTLVGADLREAVGLSDDQRRACREKGAVVSDEPTT